MRNETRFTMVTPSVGFATRTMTRIAEHERAQARRRAWIGSALLVVVASAMLLFVGVRLFSLLTALSASPETVEAVTSALATVMFWVKAFAEALWIAAGTILLNIGDIPMLAYALFVLALTMIWLRVATGSFQFSTSQTIVGGSR